PRSASTLGYVCSFEHHAPRIHDRGVQRGHVWRWRDPRKTASVVVIGAGPPFERYYIERALDPKRFVEQQRQLPDRHPVPHRNRKHADKRTERRVEDRAFDLKSSYRIWAVQHYEPLLRFARGLHRKSHRVDE